MMKLKGNTFSLPGSTVNFTVMAAFMAMRNLAGQLLAAVLYNLSVNREKLQIRYANLRV